MRRILLLCVAIFALANENLSQKERADLKIYEQIFSGLKTEEIPKFVEYLAADILPRRLDDIVVLNSINTNALTINANFTINDTAGLAVSKFNQAQIKQLRDDFITNGKNTLCGTSISRAIMDRGIKFVGSYMLDGKHVFDIVMDKKSCE